MKDFYQVKEALRERIRELHRIAPGSIGDQMQYEVLDGEEGVYQMRCRTFDWMRNGPGTLHGGMCATIVDQAMGFVAYCAKPGEGIAPTVQLQVEYHRPILPGHSVLVDVRLVSATRSLMHLSANVYQESEPDKLCLSATSVFFYKPEEK